jgi:hypothetical protein
VVFLIANRDGRVVYLGCTAGTFSASGATCEGMSHLTPHTRTYILWSTELLRFFPRLHSLQRYHLQRCLGDELHCLPGQQCQRRWRGHVHVQRRLLSGWHRGHPRLHSYVDPHPFFIVAWDSPPHQAMLADSLRGQYVQPGRRCHVYQLPPRQLQQHWRERLHMFGRVCRLG